MKYIIICLLLLISGTVAAQHSFSAYIGYYTEDFRWSVAGNLSGTNPDIYSELIWDGTAGVAFGFEANVIIRKRVRLIGSYDQVSLNSGKVNDTDYQADGRMQPSYQASFQTKSGNIKQTAIAAGYQVSEGKLVLVPRIGYLWSCQDLYIPGAALNSSYEARWNGPYAGGGLAYTLDKVKLNIDLSYAQLNYKATADWKAIPTYQHPVSFTHSAKGYQIGLKFNTEVAVASRLVVFAGAAWQHAVTGSGTDRLYLSSGSVTATKLNEVVRKSLQLSGGVKLLF